MALTVDQCDALLGILDVHSVRNYTLESLSNEIHKKFDNSEYFKVGTCIIMLLQNDLLPEAEQRLAAITLLYELYRGESLANTPFANVFIHILYPPEHQSNVGAPKLEYPGQLPRLSPPEKHFITQLISDIPKDALLKKTASQIVNSDGAPHVNVDFSSIQLTLAEKQSELPQTCKAGIPVILSLPEKTSNSYTSDSQKDDLVVKKLVTAENAPVNRVYKPEFVMLSPPLLNCQDEPVWLNPTTPKEHTIAYDTTMCVPDMAGYEARQLMNKAYKSALSIPQQQQLLSELENESKLVYHIGLTPSKLIKLILRRVI